MRKLNAKNLTTLIGILYVLGTTALWIYGDKADVNKMGKLIVTITYIATLLVMLVLRITNGNGFNFKRSAFVNPIDRAKIYKTTFPIVSVLIIIGLILSAFVYRTQFNYMYDFVTLVIVLLMSWNVVVIMGDRIDQLKDKKQK